MSLVFLLTFLIWVSRSKLPLPFSYLASFQCDRATLYLSVEAITRDEMCRTLLLKFTRSFVLADGGNMLRNSALRGVFHLSESLCREFLKLFISKEPVKSFISFLNSLSARLLVVLRVALSAMRRSSQPEHCTVRGSSFG